MTKPLHENEIATIVIDTCIKIHQRYGPGLLESVYEEILCYELRKLGFHVSRQQDVPLIHEELYIPIAFRADVIVNHLVLVELKSASEVPAIAFKIAHTYVKLTHLKLGLMINFNVGLLKDGVRRIVNGL